jgi:VanZ family protein
VYRIWLIVIAVIVYGSLYPWDFHSRQLPASPPWILIHAWPPVIDRDAVQDAAVNVVIYIPLGLFGFLALRRNMQALSAFALTVMIGLVICCSMEMIQLFIPERECDAADATCNVIGTAIGAGLGFLYQRWLGWLEEHGKDARFLRLSGTVLLIYAWIAYQVFPFIPVPSRTRLTEKVDAVFAVHAVSRLEMLTCFVEWLVLAQLLALLIGNERVRRFFPLLLLVLPARVFLVGRTVTWSEVGGAIAGCIGVYFLTKGDVAQYSGKVSLLAGLIVLVIVLRGLAPYHWSSVGQPFEWMPFNLTLALDREVAMLVFLRKCFWYGSVVWLLRAAGWRLWVAAFAIALLLCVIEISHLHIVGRTAETTDPLLALILAAVFGSLEEPGNASGGLCAQAQS